MNGIPTGILKICLAASILGSCGTPETLSDKEPKAQYSSSKSPAEIKYCLETSLMNINAQFTSTISPLGDQSSIAVRNPPDLGATLGGLLISETIAFYKISYGKIEYYKNAGYSFFGRDPYQSAAEHCR